MVDSFNTSSAFVVFAVILFRAMIGWCQICGKTSYGGKVKSACRGLNMFFF